MAQFDIFQQRGVSGYWLDCQTELLGNIASRFVVPLIPIESAPVSVRQLNPLFEIDGRQYLMLTQQAGPVPVSELRKSVGSLARHRYEIIKALDFLITGV